MKITLFSTIVLAALLAVGAPNAVNAAPNKPAAAKSHQMSGTIVSMDDSSLVLSHGVAKKQMTFKLTADTKRSGTLSTGSKVTVMYREDGSEHTATSIRASGTHTTATKPAASKPAKSS